MKVLYYNSFSGISGDMHLGAMIDLGVDPEYLLEELRKLGLSHEYNIEIKKDARKGITGTKVDVVLLNGNDNHHESHCKVNHNHDNYHYHEIEDCHDEHQHEKSHCDERQIGHEKHCHNHEEHCKVEQHNHSHEHDNSNDHHEHRNQYRIEEIINNSELKPKVKELSIDIFKKVAEAEAKVHGKTLYEVHFHEVGATDSIVDIVGAAICLDYLKVDKILASSVEVGGGFVKCAHGIMPVPAPATAEILRGVPIKVGAVPFETTTPTGAAILKTVVDKFTEDIDFIIDKVAYGIGNRDTDIPNVLRVYLGHYEEIAVSVDAEYDRELIIECNIDDMNSEVYEYVFEKLFKLGVKDVYITPIIMKKGRPAQKLTVLSPYRISNEVERLLLLETTTFGVRKYEVEKTMLSRDFINVATKYGEVKVKRGIYNGEVIKYKGEYDCCKEVANRNGITLEEVYNEIKKNM